MARAGPRHTLASSGFWSYPWLGPQVDQYTGPQIRGTRTNSTNWEHVHHCFTGTCSCTPNWHPTALLHPQLAPHTTAASPTGTTHHCCTPSWHPTALLHPWLAPHITAASPSDIPYHVLQHPQPSPPARHLVIPSLQHSTPIPQVNLIVFITSSISAWCTTKLAAAEMFICIPGCIHQGVWHCIIAALLGNESQLATLSECQAALPRTTGQSHWDYTQWTRTRTWHCGLHKELGPHALVDQTAVQLGTVGKYITWPVWRREALDLLCWHPWGFCRQLHLKQSRTRSAHPASCQQTLHVWFSSLHQLLGRPMTAHSSLQVNIQGQTSCQHHVVTM